MLSDVLWLACRLARSDKKRFSLLRFLFDAVIFIFGGVGTVLLCYYFNKGVFRIFCVFGLAVGISLWYAGISRAMRAVLLAVSGLVIRIISVIMTPFVKIFNLLGRFLKKTKYYIIKTLAEIIILVYNIYIKGSILKRSAKGFLKTKRG